MKFKKLLILALLLSVSSGSLVGCGNTSEKSDIGGIIEENIDKDIDTYGNEKGLLVRAEKHAYEDGNAILFYAENQTVKNFDILIRVNYFDDSGVRILTQSKSFKDFPSGYKNCFIFMTDKPFNSFTYKLSAKEHFGQSVMKYLKASSAVSLNTAPMPGKQAFYMNTDGSAEELDPDTLYVSVFAMYYPVRLIKGDGIDVECTYVFLDKNGDIVKLLPVSYKNISSRDAEMQKNKSAYLFTSNVPFDSKDEYTLPKSYEKLTLVTSIVSARK